MTKTMIALLMGGALILSVGCDKKEEAAGGKDGKTGSSADSIGVQECDDYFKKVESCMGKMPAEAKTAMEASLKQNRDAWKQAASGPGKDTLKTTCKAALDAMAQNPACK